MSETQVSVHPILIVSAICLYLKNYFSFSLYLTVLRKQYKKGDWFLLRHLLR